jgi:hypothetical protein
VRDAVFAAIIAALPMAEDWWRGPFTRNDAKEELSYAYVHAVAAAAGFSVDVVKKDRSSIDVAIRAHGRIVDDGDANAILSVQLKATSLIQAAATDDHFTFALKKKNYDDLRERGQSPLLLVVFLMPKKKEQWLTSDHHNLITRHCAYWRSLFGAPAVKNATKKTVAIPLKNRFDPKTLRHLMVMSARGQDILDAPV